MKFTIKFFALLFGVLMLANAANAESPRVQLKQMVEQLQANPADDALREKIIKLARKIKPAPAMPEEARRSFVEGNTITRTAKDAKEQQLAVDSFKEALKMAPWWGDAYYNLAVVQELAGQLDDSEKSLQFYLLTNPGEKEAREAQDRIYALDAKKKLDAQEQAAKTNEKAVEEARYGWMLGRWNYTMSGCNGNCRMEGVIEARKSGNQIVLKETQGTTYLGNHAPESWSKDYAQADGFIRGTISPSGEITWEGKSDDTPGCPASWSPIHLDISSDHRTFNYDLQRRFYQLCTPTGSQDSYTLTHE